MKFGNGMKLTALAVAVLVSGTACSGAGESANANPTSSNDAICENTEGQVLWYFGNAPTVLERVTAGFAKEHPDIKIQALSFTGSEGSARFSSEAEAGVSSADLIYHAVPGWGDTAMAKGWLHPLDATYLPALADYPKEYQSRSEAIVSVRLANMMINTKDLPNPPSGWKDLLDPKYKGKIVMTDPRNIPAWMALFSILYSDPNYGPAYLKSLAAQQPILVQSSVPGAAQVAAGQGAVLIVPTLDSVTAPLIKQGAPVKAVDLSPTTGIETTLSVAEKAAHPKAARCLANWLATKAGQEAINGDGAGSSPLPNVPGATQLPKNYIRPDVVATGKNKAAILSALGLS
jgi:iron(III) transport system substrate-binding protein